MVDRTRFADREFVRHRSRVRCAAMALALVGSSMVGFVATATPASAATTGVNVDSYCLFTFGYHAYVRYWNAYGWRCNPVGHDANQPYPYSTADQPVDMRVQCRLQGYSGTGFTDYNNPYSWYCSR